MKHNIATLAYLVYDVDTQDIKTELGRVPESDVFETTYGHLSAMDTTELIEEAFGVESGEEDKSLTPARCGTCGEGQPPGAKARRNCGEVFTPDAQAAKEQVSDDVKLDYADTKPGDDSQDKLDAIDDLLQDPEVKAALFEQMGVP